DNTVTTSEDTTYTFAAAAFEIGRATCRKESNFNRVKITTITGAGTLKLSGSAVSAGAFVTVANIPNLTFEPVANVNGSPYTTFTFQVEDDGASSGLNQNLDASPNTMTINVSSVNDAPAGTDNTVTTSEDTTYAFAAAAF